MAAENDNVQDAQCENGLPDNMLARFKEKGEKKMEYKNEKEKAIFEEGIEEGKLQMKKEIAYHMYEMGGANWRIAEILGESESTIERWIYEENWNRGQEEGMQLLVQVAVMLLNEERYEDLKRLDDEAFRNQAIKEYYEKKKQEETGTPEPR